jgi:hypothetical protein
MGNRKPIKKPGAKYSEAKIRKALLIADIVKKHYEHGNAAKNLTQVWRKHVNKEVPCSERSFKDLIRLARVELAKIGEEFLPKQD